MRRYLILIGLLSIVFIATDILNAQDKSVNVVYIMADYLNNEPYILKENNFALKQGKYTHDIFVNEALRYVEKDNPSFLYLALTIPHLELTVSEESKQPYLDLGQNEHQGSLQ